MNRYRLDDLRPNTRVTLLFCGSKSLGNNAYEADAIFLRIEGTGEDRRALFCDEVGESNSTRVWEAYRYYSGSGKTRMWAYGTSAERLRLLSVNGV